MTTRRFQAALFTSFALIASAATAIAASDREVLWEPPPGPTETLDFTLGAGGRDGLPQPPFQFVKEDLSGTNPKVLVTDAAGRSWSVKWGVEGKPETFLARLAWAAGYFAVPTHFVREGTIVEAHGLRRAANHIRGNGHFRDARFQLRDKNLRLLDDQRSWTWERNPFLGAPELGGLKVLTMLVSNWDTKDARDRGRGSNTGIFIDAREPGVTHYAFYDWGASLGRWGGVLGRSKWDCDGFARQTPDFVRAGGDGTFAWGFHGQRTDDIRSATGDDVRWFLTRMGSLTDSQLREGLHAAGASPDEMECFARALRSRLTMLQALASTPAEVAGMGAVPTTTPALPAAAEGASEPSER